MHDRKRARTCSATPAQAVSIEGAPSLRELLGILGECGDNLSTTASLSALQRLPELLAEEVVPHSCTAEMLAKRLATGERIQTWKLPSRPSDTANTHGNSGQQKITSKTALNSYLWLHLSVEEALCDKERLSELSLEWFASAATFWGAVHLEPSMSNLLLANAADAVRQRLRSKGAAEDLALACHFARGVATSGVLADSASGALMRHALVPRLLQCCAALVLRCQTSNIVDEQYALFSTAMLHDCALAVALARPWDDVTELAIKKLVGLLPAPTEVAAIMARDGHREVSRVHAPEAATHASAAIGGHSQAGARSGSTKENQDRMIAVTDPNTILACVIDGHGRHGELAAEAIREILQEALPALPCPLHGAFAEKALARLLKAADAYLLLNAAVDSRLCGATCAIVRVERPAGTAAAPGRIAVAHLGDCRVVLGRRGEQNASWQAIRLTQDHLVSDPMEARRIAAQGGCVRCVQHMIGVGATDLTGLGPPRLWSRLLDGVPGLAVSRGLGDALGQSCGLSSDAATLEAALRPEDLVIIVASDGVFDMMSDRAVLERCLPHRRGKDAEAAAEAVVSAAGRAWARLGDYRDDATCVVIFL